MISSIVNKLASSKPPTQNTSSKSPIFGLSKAKTWKYRKNIVTSPQVSAKVLKQQAANFTEPVVVKEKSSSVSASVLDKPTPNKIKMSYSLFKFNQQLEVNGHTKSSTSLDIMQGFESPANGGGENSENENAVAQSLFASSSSNSKFEKMTLPVLSTGSTKSSSCETEQEEILVPSANCDNKPRFADEPEYRMDNLRRGYAIIINNKYFDSKLDMPIREGTDQDAECLEFSLRRLGFDTQLHNDCCASSMRDLLGKYAKLDHSDADCFLCVMLSHGENGMIYAIDRELELDALIQPFKYNRTLAGKPKLFFIQACRGTQYMEGIDANPFAVEYVSKIPMEADFLFAYSTVAGYYSWRNSCKGSWFIQSLCKILDKYGSNLEIMQLLTAVNRRVAYFFESNTNDPELNHKKQVPCIVSMLTKELYFKLKTYQIGSSIRSNMLNSYTGNQKI